MARVVRGLRYAAKSDPPPAHRPGKPRGAKAHGVRYERELAKALPDGAHGQWFQFVDENGHGWCQPDLLLEFPRHVVILEAKYTWTWEGHMQVDRLYVPVVSRAMGKPAFGLVVCRALIEDMGDVLIQSHLGEASIWAQRGKRVAMHWLGGGNFLKLAGLEPYLGKILPAHAPILVPRARIA